jgi:ABC-2 type transport system ATP-binding protein
VHKPPVIILDEPTAGVDVELRQGLWEFVRQLNADGHTIVLTTHYLEEAETLCSRVGMLKQGRLVALDRTENLLKGLSGIHLHVRVTENGSLPAAVLSRGILCADGQLRFALKDYAEMEQVLALIRTNGLHLLAMELAQPDLEEVFVSIMRDSP